MGEQHIGELSISGTNDGVTVNVDLLIVGSDVTGFGRFNDSVRNRSFGVSFAGQTHSTGLGKAKQLFALSGTPIPNLPGASNIPTMQISLDGIWGSAGKADYTVWNDNPPLEIHSGMVQASWK